MKNERARLLRRMERLAGCRVNDAVKLAFLDGEQLGAKTKPNGGHNNVANIIIFLLCKLLYTIFPPIRLKKLHPISFDQV